MSASVRPPFVPSLCNQDNITVPALIQAHARDDSQPESRWLPLIKCPADFPPELFQVAVSQLIHHPEYNSTLILRSETLSDTDRDFPPSVPSLDGHRQVQCIQRRLLARRPGRDASLDQYCTLYAEGNDSETTESHTADLPTTLILTPIIPPGSSLPYYHPSVYHLAFRYITQADSPPFLRIEVLPLPGTPTDPNSRLYRTCLALLDTLHRYLWGAQINYTKRVKHDCLVPREVYQDLYLVMRERHKHLVDTWQEVTDPLKHVFEDIGIATYMMLLWKDTFKTPTTEDATSQQPGEDLANEPWKAWPRPPGGFLDLGCGNGLLTHILTAESYAGEGIDLRARTSWSHYPSSTQAHLHVHAFDPLNSESPYLPSPPKSSTSEAPCESSSESPSTATATAATQEEYLHEGVWIIANHADELTPWVPVLSTLHSASGYISIPCCSWAFDARFERGGVNSDLGMFHGLHGEDEEKKGEGKREAFVESLNLGGEGARGSAYSMYRIWLASLSLWCGWEVECEVLRIPSTRNWAIVGRRRTGVGGQEGVEDAQGEAVERARDIVRNVRERGIFKTRKPEGKAGDH